MLTTRIVAVIMSWVITGALCSLDEMRLIKSLMEKYNPSVRPVTRASEALPMQMDVALNQIVNMDQKYQILVSMVWLRMYWKDEHLQWNPEDHGNITAIRLKPESVWVPDITLYEDAGEKGMKNIQRYSIKYTYDGNATWLAPILLTSSCTLELAAFPYDKQRCNLTLASWTFHGYDLDLQPLRDVGDITSFNSNGEWDVEEVPVVRVVKFYNCCSEPYPQLVYTIVMTRQPLFYTFNLFVPCVVITAITAVGFYLPPDSGEKCSFMITIMLSLTVFLLMVAESMPPSSVAIPLIGWYFAGAIILVAISTTLTVIVIATHHRGNHNKVVPNWIRRLVFGFIAPMIGRRTMVREMGYWPTCKVSSNTMTFNVNGHKSSEDPEPIIINSIQLTRPTIGEVIPVKNPNVRTNQILGQIASHTQYLSELAESKDKSNRVCEEWQLVAIILDRLFFYLFGAVILIMGIFIFSYRP